MYVTPASTPNNAKRFSDQTAPKQAKAQEKSPVGKPEVPNKPLHLASFMTDEKKALRNILDTPLPKETEVLGRCVADKEEIKTYKKESGFQRVDIKHKGEVNEESIRTFSALDSEPGIMTPRGRVCAVETKIQGSAGVQDRAPAVHTFHYSNGLSQTVAESEKGEMFLMSMRQQPAS
jgi:hypothetical protein